MSRIAVQITGFKEVRASLGDLTVRMADAAARKAVRAGARPIITQARANIAALPLADSTGLLRRSIGVRIKKYRSRRPVRAAFVTEARIANAAGLHMAIIGPRSSVQAVVQRLAWNFRGKGLASRVSDRVLTKAVKSVPANYGHLIEGGVQPHTTGRGSSIRKGVSGGIRHPGFHAKPWLEPAFRAKQVEAQTIMRRVFFEALQAETARARAKAGGRR